MLRTVLGHVANPRVSVLDFQRNASLPAKLFVALCGAFLTAVAARLRIHLPFTPVPVTGQVFTVLLCGALLGARYGALSQTLYLGLAILGVPWLAGNLATNAGYLVGFVIAAGFLGAVTPRSPWARSLHGQLTLMLAAVAIIYLSGAAVLMMALNLTPVQAAVAGVLPFIAADLCKVILAAAITSRLLRP